MSSEVWKLDTRAGPLIASKRLRCWAKSRLPRHVWNFLSYAKRACRRCVGSLYYLRAQRILRAYRMHYAAAQRVFIRDGCQTRPVVEPLSDFGVRVVRLGVDGNCIDLPGNYPKLVHRVTESAASLLGRSRNCVFAPGLVTDVDVPQATADVPEVRSGGVMMVQLRNPLAVAGLEELCQPVIDEVERKVYGSYTIVDKVYIYRSAVFHGIKRGAWLWHYDNHPPEVLKVMIYLTDVDAETGPFEYLHEGKTQRPIMGGPVAPLYGDSRIPEKALKDFLARGFEEYRVIGPRGTMILFDDNVLHRAAVPSRGYRDVLIFQIRPSSSRRRPCVNARWTGSFQHAPFNPDPSDFRPLTRRLRHFS
jgi:hypothetical protein